MRRLLLMMCVVFAALAIGWAEKLTTDLDKEPRQVKLREVNERDAGVDQGEADKGVGKDVGKDAEDRNKLLVKKMMRAVHRGPTAPLNHLDKEIRNMKPDWPAAAKSAEFVDVMALTLGKDDQAAAYRLAAGNLTKAVKAKDAIKSSQAISDLKASCIACHGWGGPPK